MGIYSVYQIRISTFYARWMLCWWECFNFISYAMMTIITTSKIIMIIYNYRIKCGFVTTIVTTIV